MTNQVSKLNKIISLGFFLFPFLLVTGPFLPDLFVVITCIYFIFANGLKSSFLKYKKEFIFFLAFFLYLNLNSLLVSEQKFIAAKVSVPYLRYFIFSFLIIYFLFHVEKFKKFFFYSCIICLVVLFLDSFYQFYNKANILGYPIYDNRISSFFNEELILGSYTSKVIIILLAISFSLDLKDNNKKFIHFFIFFIGYFLILLSNERTAFAYLVIIFSIYCLIELNLKNFSLTIFFIFILNLILYTTYPKSFERIIFHSIDQIKNSKSLFLSSYRHDLHYFTALQMFKEKPFLGNGLKSFRYKCSDPIYKVKEKVLKDKAVYAKGDGYIEIKNQKKIYLITNNKEEVFIGLQFRNQSPKILKIFEQIKKGQYLGSFYEFENGCNTHPHNTHFQFLAELGLIGYVFLLVTILYLIKDIFKIIKKKFYDRLKLLNYEKSYVVCLTGLLIQINPLFPSGSFFNNYNSIIFFMIASFSIYFKYINKTQ